MTHKIFQHKILHLKIQQINFSNYKKYLVKLRVKIEGFTEAFSLQILGREWASHTYHTHT